MWLTKANLLIYCSHFLSCWGNQMWMFGMGIFLVRIADDSIQLSATYGLVTGLAIFFFGALVGDWVDNTPRLKAAQLSLVLQDALMLGSAAVVTAYLWHRDDIRASSNWLSPLLQAVIVALGVMSNLAAQARVIAVERDWIVEICGVNFDHLASMTAMLRRIDQISMILAPIATGQVMTYIGLVYGAFFIGGWNVLSVFVELFLMWKVYNTVPALTAKKNTRRSDDIVGETKSDPEPSFLLTPALDNTMATVSPEDNSDEATALSQHLHATEEEGATQQQTQLVASSPSHLAADSAQMEAAVYVEGGRRQEAGEGGDGVTCLARVGSRRVLYQFVTLYWGWKTYVSYSVALAGLALAFLYMTVLDFHNITVAYAVTQGLSESVLGILMGSSAVFGIIGTFAYPVIRRHAGLVRTGLIALSCQVSCLTLCIVSIWMPGSPFDPFYTNTGLGHPGRCGTGNTSGLVVTQVSADSALELRTTNFINSSTVISVSNNSTDSDNGCDGLLTKRVPDSYLSVIFLMAGIFLARFGVWVADLTITQLFLEKVVPTQRGIVNGVQSSLNQLMDLLKFALVVILPDTETFGFLIMISFCFIATAWILYAVFVRRERVPLCVCPSNARETRDNS